MTLSVKLKNQRLREISKESLAVDCEKKNQRTGGGQLQGLGGTENNGSSRSS